MADDLRRIIDDPNLSNEEIAKRVRENLGDDENELFVKLDNDPQMTDADLHLLLSYDLDKLDEVFGFLLDKYDMSEEDLIEYAKYKRKQYGVDVETEKSELFARLDKEITNPYAIDMLLNVDLNNPTQAFEGLAAAYGVSTEDLVEYAKYKRKQRGIDVETEKSELFARLDKEITNPYAIDMLLNVDLNNPTQAFEGLAAAYGVSTEDLVEYAKYKRKQRGIEVDKSSSEARISDDKKGESVSKEDLYKEYLEIEKRLDEIESIMRENLKTEKKTPSELAVERNRLLDRKRELLPQVEDMLNINDNKKKPRKLSDYVEEQKQEKEKQEKEKADDNEIVSERDGSFLSKAKGFIDKVKNLSTKGKIIGLAGLAAAGLITAVYMAMKHGDVQTLNDALHQAGMHIQDAANQLNPDPSGIDPSTIGQHIDTTFVSSGDAANYAHALKPIEEDFQYDIQNLVDSHNNIIPAHGMSYDELIELIKNGNDIASVQVGGDAAHIDGHLNINDILNAYDATVKSGGAVR